MGSTPSSQSQTDLTSMSPDNLKYVENIQKSEKYKLNPKEMEQLKRNGFLFRENPTKNQSFAHMYLDLQNNGLPIMITCDSMLDILHKVNLKSLGHKCVNLLNFAYEYFGEIRENMEKIRHEEINDPIALEILESVELLFTVCYILSCYITAPKAETFNGIDYNCKSIGEVIDYNTTVITVHPPHVQGVHIHVMKHITNDDIQKLKAYRIFHKIPEYMETTLMEWINRNKHYNYSFHHFQTPDVYKKPNLKFTTHEKLNKIVTNIIKGIDFELKFGSETIKYTKESFEPPHQFKHADNPILFFRLFGWINKINIPLTTYENVIFSSITSILLGKSHEKSENFHKQLFKIFGHSIGVNYSDFNNLMNKFMSIEARECDFINSILWVLTYGQELHLDIQNIMKEYEKRKSFVMFNTEMNIDNYILSEAKKENVSLSLFDMSYVLFDNKSAKAFSELEDIYSPDSDTKNNFVNKIHYAYKEHSQVEVLCEQFLKLARSMYNDMDDRLLKEYKQWPFNQNIWQNKVLQTQIGYYTQINNMTTSLKQIEEIPKLDGPIQINNTDIYIEPTLGFWKEYHNTIQMLMKDEFYGKNIYLNNLNKVSEYILTYVSTIFAGNTPSEELTNYLKNIVSKNTFLDGWYSTLEPVRKTSDNCLLQNWINIKKFDNDNYVGLGDPQLMYVLIVDENTNKMNICIGPVYTTHYVENAKEKLDDNNWRNIVETTGKDSKIDFNS
jgi:hypothetical protein